MCARESIATALLVALACLPMTACSQSPARKSSSPGASSPGQDQTRDEDPLAELARLEQQMLALGIDRAPTAPAGAGEGAAAGMDGDAMMADEAEADVLEEAPAYEVEAADAAPAPPSEREPRSERQARVNQCEDVCDLNEAICDLEQRICSLSESHAGDPTYADACRRAQDDCAVSGDACDRCGA